MSTRILYLCDELCVESVRHGIEVGGVAAAAATRIVAGIAPAAVVTEVPRVPRVASHYLLESRG